ncbi:CopD family protein [soil metagenome]
MYQLAKLFHVAAAIVWMGGMFFMLWALRPVAATQLHPPARAPFMAAVLGRFFLAVWISISVLLVTGGVMLGATGMKAAPIGQHVMLGIGLLMFALFGHIYFGPYRRLGKAVASLDWPAAGAQMGKIQPFVVANFILGWVAIGAVILIG